MGRFNFRDEFSDKPIEFDQKQTLDFRRQILAFNVFLFNFRAVRHTTKSPPCLKGDVKADSFDRGIC